MPTTTIVNILPFGSYDILISMTWMATHRTKVYYYGKSLECIDDEWEEKVFQGIRKHVLLR